MRGDNMKILYGLNKEKTVEVFEMADRIDDVFHDMITQHTGCTVSHADIYAFIYQVVNDNNETELKMRRALKKAEEEFEKIMEY